MAAHLKRDWASTAEVAAAGNITDSTAMKWAARGLLPAYENISKGRRGRAARWPAHAPLQAAWVADLMRQGYTFDDIKKALDEGAFKPELQGASVDGDPSGSAGASGTE